MAVNIVGMSIIFGLAVGFFLTAVVFATVGFGGGSSYAALLAAAGADYRLLPILALLCNVLVVSGATCLYAKAGYLRWRLAVPLSLCSVPAAWYGGSLVLSREDFMLLFSLLLLASSLALLWQRDGEAEPPERPVSHLLLLGLLLGAPLGLISGVSGIGGGIFLAPVLLQLRLASVRVVAATASFFILINSLAGLFGQFHKGSWQAVPWHEASPYLYLLPLVFIGGQIGSRLGMKVLSEIWVRRVTALLVFSISLHLLVGS